MSQLGYPGTSRSGSITSVNSSASDVQILAANDGRRGATIYNDSTQILFLGLSSETTSTSNFTVQIPADAYFEVPYVYAGEIRGIWASANGAARITEFT